MEMGYQICAVLLCSGERAPGTHCTGGYAIVAQRSFLGALEKGKIYCPCCKSNHESLVLSTQTSHHTE